MEVRYKLPETRDGCKVEDCCQCGGVCKGVVQCANMYKCNNIGCKCSVQCKFLFLLLLLYPELVSEGIQREGGEHNIWYDILLVGCSWEVGMLVLICGTLYDCKLL